MEHPDDATTETSSARPSLLRPPSLWSVDMIGQMGLTLFTDKEAGEALPESEQKAQIEAFLWVHHRDIDEDVIEDAIYGAAWKEEVRRFRRDPRMLWALPEVTVRMEELMRILKG